MAKHISISNKFLGGALIVAILINYVLPRIGLGGLSDIALAIELIIAIYLLFLA